MEIIRMARGTRKRIWEVDCVSMDGALAGSFDWRELANFLDGAGRLHAQRGNGPESLSALNVQGLVHHACHSENPLSLRLEKLLNRWHDETIGGIVCCDQEDLMRLVLAYPFSERRQTAGLCWALGTDPRAEADCIRRRFHQRFQIESLRRLA